MGRKLRGGLALPTRRDLAGLSSNAASCDLVVLLRHRLFREPDGFEAFGLLLEHPKASDLPGRDPVHERAPRDHFYPLAPPHVGGVHMSGPNREDSARALKSLPGEPSRPAPAAAPSPPPARGLALGGAQPRLTTSSKFSGEGGRADEWPAGKRRGPRPYLRHDAEGRRAVAGHLPEHGGEGRDRAA